MNVLLVSGENPDRKQECANRQVSALTELGFNKQLNKTIQDFVNTMSYEGNKPGDIGRGVTAVIGVV